MKHSIRRRGRPKASYEANDLGTPELIAKRAFGITKEPFDALLERKIITQDEHIAGMWLRWLHSLQFGIPRPSAYDASYVGGTAHDKYSPAWLAARAEEYHLLSMHLKKLQLYLIVANICIYQQPIPANQYHRLKEGLALLHRVRKKALPK